MNIIYTKQHLFLENQVLTPTLPMLSIQKKPVVWKAQGKPCYKKRKKMLISYQGVTNNTCQLRFHTVWIQNQLLTGGVVFVLASLLSLYLEGGLSRKTWTVYCLSQRVNSSIYQMHKELRTVISTHYSFFLALVWNLTCVDKCLGTASSRSPWIT